jgi:hypothetical protein
VNDGKVSVNKSCIHLMHKNIMHEMKKTHAGKSISISFLLPLGVGGLHTHIKISQSIIQACFKIGAGFTLPDN